MKKQHRNLILLILLPLIFVITVAQVLKGTGLDVRDTRGLIYRTTGTAMGIYMQGTNYDPTNGTNSRGEIRWNKSPNVIDVIPSRPNTKVVTVGKPGSGAMFTDIQTAIDSITDESDSNRYTVLIYPGTYTIISSITMTDYVDLMGVDRDNCIIYSESIGIFMISVDSNSRLTDLSIVSNISTPNLTYPIKFSAGTLSNFCIDNLYINAQSDGMNTSGDINFDNVRIKNTIIKSNWDILAFNAPTHTGKINFIDCDFILKSTATNDGNTYITGSNSFIVYFNNCRWIDESATKFAQIYVGEFATVYFNNCFIYTTGIGQNTYGIKAYDSSIIYILNSYIKNANFGSNNYDLIQSSSSIIYVSNVQYSTSSGTITPLNEGVKKFEDVILDGNVTLTNATEVYLPDNNPYAMTIGESTNRYWNFDTTNSAEKIDVYKPLYFDGSYFRFPINTSNALVFQTTTQDWYINCDSQNKKVDIYKPLYFATAQNIYMIDNNPYSLIFKEYTNSIPYFIFDTSDGTEKNTSNVNFNIASGHDLLYNTSTVVIDNGVVQASQIQDSYLLNTGDTATGSYVFTTDDFDIDGTNHNIGIGINTNQTIKLIDILSDSTLDWNRVLFIDHDNNATEDSIVIEIDNDASPGTVNNTEVALYNFYDTLTPTITLTASNDAYTSSIGSKNSLLNLASITLGTTSSDGVANIDAFGQNTSITGNPIFNNAGGTGNNILNIYGDNNMILSAPVLTNVRAGSELNAYGSYNSNIITSGGNANLTANTYGVYGASVGNLTTTGTTAHYGGYFVGGETADVNYGIYATVSGASTNWAGYFSGNVYSTGVVTGTNFVSNIAIGTQPYACTSTTVNTNLNADLLDGQHASQIQPIGSLIMWGTTSAPNGWLICDGSAVSRTTYSDLFAVIGTTFGVGNGSTTFNLPQLKSKFPAGYNSADTDFDTMGETGGVKTHTHTGTTEGHTHASGESVGIYAGNDQYAWDNVDSASKTDTFTTGSSSNLVPYITLVFIIKY